MITGVAKVVVRVDDQERAKQFWTGAIGFDVVMDEVYCDERWIEVEAPDRSVVLVLSRRPIEREQDHPLRLAERGGPLVTVPSRGAKHSRQRQRAERPCSQQLPPRQAVDALRS